MPAPAAKSPAPAFVDHLDHLKRIREAALEAADPAKAVHRAFRLHGDMLRVPACRLRLGGRLWVVAFGKAAVPMSRAFSEAVHDRFAGGVASAPAAGLAGVPAGIEPFSGGHPLPTEGSVEAGERVARILQSARKEDIVVALVSGGGSAMLELPVPGVSLKELQTVNQVLLRSGLDIQEVNLIRSALSQIKAGGLARLASPAQVVALVLSDVPGDDPAAVASGPTVPRAGVRRRARGLLHRAGLWDSLPAQVRAALKAPRPSPRRIPPPVTRVIVSNRQAVRAAAEAARLLGFHVRRLASPVEGEARLAASRLTSRWLRLPLGSCLAAGGETTVTFQMAGRGGRNQEMALQVALNLEGRAGMAWMAFATDGIDGPTDAAGAIVTGSTASQIRRRGLDPEAALAAHDSYPALDAVGALVRTGPTGTNVADLIVGLRYFA
jgi:glycerate-2-kinase